MDQQSTILQPGSLVKAKVSLYDVKQIALNLYNTVVVKVEELNGYDDRNYLLSDDKGKEIVIKIINSIDSNKPEIFEAQSLLLEHLSSHGIPCSLPIKTKKCTYFEKYKLESGEHIVRALKYVPGTILANVPLTNDLLFQIGETAARIDNVMKNFNNPVFNSYQSIWMLDSVPQILQFLPAVDNVQRQVIIKMIVDQFKKKIIPFSHRAPKGLIHGDLNEQNIIVDKTTNGSYQIKAIIDYGDCHVGCYMYELAITMTYAMLLDKSIEAGGYILAGYMSLNPISDDELSLIKLCILARLCQSLVLGAYTNQQDPTNTYVLATAAFGWSLLETLWSEPDSAVLQKWKIL